MTRWERRALVAGLLVIAFVADWTISNPGPCVPSKRQQGDQRAERRCSLAKTLTVRSIDGAIGWVDRRHDFVTAAATVVIALFTITLWRATRGLLESAKVDALIAKKAADAAKKSADATAAADRPHPLMIELSASGLLGTPDATGKVELTLGFKFQNFGKSPAFLNEHSFDLNWDTNLPAVPPYPAPNVLPFIIAPVTGTYYRPPIGGVFIPKAIADDVAAGRRSLHFFGKLDYEDILDTPHVFRYCYRLVFQGKDATIAFRPAGLPSYWQYT